MKKKKAVGSENLSPMEILSCIIRYMNLVMENTLGGKIYGKKTVAI